MNRKGIEAVVAAAVLLLAGCGSNTAPTSTVSEADVISSVPEVISEAEEVVSEAESIPEVESVVESVPEEPAKEEFHYEAQIPVIAANEGLWNTIEGLEEWSPGIYLTDMDQDGLLEVNTVMTYGSGVFTYMKVNEVNEDLSGMHSIEIGDFTEDGPEQYFDLTGLDEMRPENIGYYDPATDTYYYLMQNNWREGIAANGSLFYKVSMINDTYQAEYIGQRDYTFDENGNETEVFSINDTTYPSELEYSAAVSMNYFSGTQEFVYSFPSVIVGEMGDVTAKLTELVAQVYLRMS